VVWLLPTIILLSELFLDLTGANIMRLKLTQAARDKIRLQLEAGTRVDIKANTFRISESQLYKMRENLRYFGRLAPDPTEF
jgi:hypothetical protein